jgi:hypothetical protein
VTIAEVQRLRAEVILELERKFIPNSINQFFCLRSYCKGVHPEILHRLAAMEEYLHDTNAHALSNAQRRLLLDFIRIKKIYLATNQGNNKKEDPTRVVLKRISTSPLLKQYAKHKASAQKISQIPHDNGSSIAGPQNNNLSHDDMTALGEIAEADITEKACRFACTLM